MVFWQYYSVMVIFSSKNVFLAVNYSEILEEMISMIADEHTFKQIRVF